MFLKYLTSGNISSNNSQRLSDNNFYLIVGFSFLLMYLMQVVLNLRWEWLDTVQSGEFYRQFTGFLLLAYVLIQGKLGLSRIRKSKYHYKDLYRQHRLQGIFGPVILYIHSIDIGFAYQTVLTFIFLGNILVGYLSPQSIAIRNKIYALSWTILHISLAILTLILMIFHMFIVYYYS